MVARMLSVPRENVLPAIAQADKILWLLKREFPTAIVIGGLFRDAYWNTCHGTKLIPKDVDVFVPTLPDTPERLARCLGTPETYGPFPMRETMFVAKFPARDDVPKVEVVRWNPETFSLEHVIRRADFGCCQIGYGGTNCWVTEQCVIDLELRKLTLCKAENPDDTRRSLTRFNRLDAKLGTDGVLHTISETHFVHQQYAQELGVLSQWRNAFAQKK